MAVTEAGIFCGLEQIANDYLRDPTWKREENRNRSFGHKTNCIRLSGNSAPVFFNASNMIDEMFARIQSNITDRLSALNQIGQKRAPSPANWNFDFRVKSNPKASEKSTRSEVTLERAIILARRSIGDTWAYQMPVATGLFDSNTDKSANIDLVRKRSDDVFDLIELKIGSNNPLYAAVEILQYGLAYAASRELASKLGYDTNRLKILDAEKIELCVLAPKSFYEPPKTDKYNFAWLEDGLNDALIKFSMGQGFRMTFKFCLLDLNWKATSRPTTETLSDINAAIDNISPAPWGYPAKA